MTDDLLELKSLCDLWQKRLRLQDWQVDIRPVDSGGLDGGKGASCFVHSEDRTAVIKILRHESYNTTSDFFKAFPDKFDIERTLIHELLHIPLDGLFDLEDETEEFKYRAQEQFIEQITDALYEAYRTRK